LNRGKIKRKSHDGIPMSWQHSFIRNVGKERGEKKSPSWGKRSTGNSKKKKPSFMTGYSHRGGDEKEILSASSVKRPKPLSNRGTAGEKNGGKN